MSNVHMIAREKFTQPFIEFMMKHFDSECHHFMVFGNAEFNVNSRKNVTEVEKRILSLFHLIRKLNTADKLFFHGLFHNGILLILFFQPWLLKKSYWIIWGGDLYWYKSRTRSLKSNLKELLRKFIIRNIAGLITPVKGDYELAQKWYGARGKYYYSFMYPSNLYKEYDLNQVKKENDVTVYVQVGNSADPSNNHIEVFEKLKNYNNKSIEIICPLSYGINEYRDEVIKLGKKLFGIKFRPIITMMTHNQYLHFLSTIDVAIFNHNRQQAMGNIITLLGLGKKVYIRSDITTWKFCAEHNLIVYNSGGNLDDIFSMIPESSMLNNINNIKLKFCESKLKEDWERILG
ncbi:TDP-N-acetylfucosamine:lipid II N-acetylfucosaminyltransferase [Paenibacillaceae bacterium WGS1546]|uniref:TDP-N-acetylfucosamine:lipid II N-acetylfucosaminyltransferase n=1 Tax=Cohnella sp. WGS1546 TaxID=3366810 RepID=UPI00372D2A67